MKNQLHFKINDDEKIVIDIVEDESINFDLYSPPKKVKGEEFNDKMYYKIDGLRWRNEEHFHLEWVHKEFNVNDIIKIELKEGDLKKSEILKEELYIQPEEECSFCSKKLSEVEVLVESSSYVFICNQCINCCQEILDSEAKNKVPIK